VRLAVLISAYNAGPDLAATLASLDSEEGEFDVVVVDDGSVLPVDLSGRVTKRHTVLIRLSSNRGVSEALNAGLGYIFGESCEYVARLDAGDRHHRQRLLTQMLWLDEHPDAAMVGAWTEHVDDEGRLLHVTRYPETWPAILRRFRYRGAFSHPTCMIRTSALRALAATATGILSARTTTCSGASRSVTRASTCPRCSSLASRRRAPSPMFTGVSAAASVQRFNGNTFD
jgi:glycosyltransferase involved in cell wall biosynthesis